MQAMILIGLTLGVNGAMLIIAFLEQGKVKQAFLYCFLLSIIGDAALTYALTK